MRSWATRPTQDRSYSPHVLPGIVDRGRETPGRPLDSSTRTDMAERFGWDFSQVRVHTDAHAATSAAAVGAHAYTVGRDVVFAQAAYAPGTHEGRRLLAHELSHVIEQSRSPGAPRAIAPTELDDPRSHSEMQADATADAAVTDRPTGGQLPQAVFAKPFGSPRLARKADPVRVAQMDQA